MCPYSTLHPIMHATDSKTLQDNTIEANVTNYYNEIQQNIVTPNNCTVLGYEFKQVKQQYKPTYKLMFKVKHKGNIRLVEANDLFSPDNRGLPSVVFKKPKGNKLKNIIDTLHGSITNIVVPDGSTKVIHKWVRYNRSKYIRHNHIVVSEINNTIEHHCMILTTIKSKDDPKKLINCWLRFPLFIKKDGGILPQLTDALYKQGHFREGLRPTFNQSGMNSLRMAIHNVDFIYNIPRVRQDYNIGINPGMLCYIYHRIYYGKTYNTILTINTYGVYIVITIYSYMS